MHDCSRDYNLYLQSLFYWETKTKESYMAIYDIFFFRGWRNILCLWSYPVSNATLRDWRYNELKTKIIFTTKKSKMKYTSKGDIDIRPLKEADKSRNVYGKNRRIKFRMECIEKMRCWQCMRRPKYATIFIGFLN